MLQVKLRTSVKPHAATPGRGVLFISYAHADRLEVLPFVQHLQPLVERMQLELFFDADELKAGDVWSDKLEAALKRCELFVLLATRASLASKFCIERELLVALDRQRSGQCRIVPVVLSDCDWKGKLLPDGTGDTLSRFQALPPEGKAVVASTGAARDTVWLGIVNALAEVLTDPAAAAPPPRAPVTIPPLLPYLCDQVGPESSVRELLKRWRQQAGPLLVMLRADATDCPDHFINRIDERHLRKLLPRLTPGVPLERCGGLKWPPTQPNLRDNTAPLQRWFLDQIVELVTGDPYASEEELLQRLRDDGTSRLFIGGVPTAPVEFVVLSLQALGLCLAQLSQKLQKVRLAAMVWSEDPALQHLQPDPSWSGPEGYIGLPEPLGRFGRDAVRDWTLLDEVRQFAVIDGTELDQAFDGAAEQLNMREFAALAQPLLQRKTA